MAFYTTKNLSLLSIIVMLTVVVPPLTRAITDVPSYVRFVQEMAANESKMAEFGGFFDARKQLYDAQFFPNGNPVVGSPHFICPSMGKRANQTADNVHSLRANDIAVVAAMGDSLMAGFGAGAHSLVELPLEYRGLAFAIGADSDLKYSVTLPNVLSQFSPLLVGGSRRVAPVYVQTFSQLNVAVSGAVAANMSDQAEELVRRVYNDDRINLSDDWKHVTLYVGSNDLCAYCLDTAQYSAENYYENILGALNILKKHLPRTIVSLVSTEHMELLKQLNADNKYCAYVHQKACPCATQAATASSDYQHKLKQLETLFDQDENTDFSVVVQPFLEDLKVPRDAASGKVNLAYMAPDCFHWSHLGHATAARALWNNLFEPVGTKTTGVNYDKAQLPCPSESCPLIRTPANSREPCEKFTEKLPPLEDVPNFVAAAKRAAADNNTLSSAIPVVIENVSGISTALILIGITFGLLIGLICGSVVYHFCYAYKGAGKAATERTPLLGGNERADSGNDNYVQLY